MSHRMYLAREGPGSRQALSRAVVVNSNMSRRMYLAREGPGSRQCRVRLHAQPISLVDCRKILLLLKGHLRALPTEIISPAKWRSNRKWRPTNGPADRLATKLPKISSFWWVLQWAAATTGPGNMSLWASAPSTENIVLVFFSSSLELMDDWPPRSTSTRRMEAYDTSRNAYVESFYLGAGLTTCWIMEAEETTRQSQVRLRRSG